MVVLQIPNSIESIYNFFNEVKSCPVKKMNPVPISALSENLFFNKEDIKNHMTFLWEVVETEEFFIWIIQSNKWDRKTWRNHFINKLQSNLATSILVFVPEKMDVSHTLEQFSMSIITTDGTLDFPSVIPEKPEESVLKVWEAIKSNTLNDILEFESQIACEKYRVTAENLYDALQTKDIEQILNIFEKAGHNIQDKYVLPKEDTILEKVILNITDTETIPKQVMRDYVNLEENDSGEEVLWIISLTPTELIYYRRNVLIKKISLDITNSKKDKEIKENILNFLASLVASISRRAAYNAETFAYQYGEFSLLYFYAIQSLKNSFSKGKEEIINVIFQEWQRRFEAVYRKGDTTEDLFLKHTYLGLLIRLVLYVVYFPDQKLKSQSIIEMTSWLEERGFSLFTYDFFSWGLEDLELLGLLYFGLKPFDKDTENNSEKIFEADDLFRTIYQQMVSPATRHALGEFYTPPELARIMIEESYQFGKKTLDPACGSGTFIVEIIRKIKNFPQKSLQEKLRALRNVYGFDVNPIAVATSKANVLMHLTDLVEENENLSTNIFLCNSLFPLELKKFKDLIYGETLEFKLPTINESVVINKKFFSDEFQKSFGYALSLLDALMIKDNIHLAEFLEKLENHLKKNEFSWMNEEIGQSVTLKDNFIYLAKYFFNLSEKNKDHIWIYLLYQSLGSFLVSKKIDLVIGNPPWLVLNGVYGTEYKNKIKILAKNLKILPEPHLVSHLEMSALFLYSAKNYLKNKGKVFFVVSNAFISGDNHTGTRQFIEYKNIKIWRFTKDFFNIHNICILCTYEKDLKRDLKDLRELIIEVENYQPNLLKTGRLLFEKVNEEEFISYSVENKKSLFMVKKFIPKEDLKNLLPLGPNAYKDGFYAGSTIFPRNLIFINIIQSSGAYVEVNSFIKNAKKPWDFNPLKELNVKSNKIKIEKKFIYKVLKSEYVVPFITLHEREAFLPIETSKEGFKITSDRESLGWKYFQNLNNLYKKKQKEGAAITDLWKRINFQNYLTSIRQKKPIKVIMMSNGTLVKACICKEENTIIDYSNFYIGLEDINEAYFIMGFLNSPCISKTVQLIQSEGAGGKGRNIYKRPFNIYFPKFDQTDKTHLQLVEQTKKMEERAKKIVDDWIQKEKEKYIKKHSKSPENDKSLLKPMTIQNRIYKGLGWDTKTFTFSGDYAELNKITKEIINKNVS